MAQLNWEQLTKKFFKSRNVQKALFVTIVLGIVGVIGLQLDPLTVPFFSLASNVQIGTQAVYIATYVLYAIAVVVFMIIADYIWHKGRLYTNEYLAALGLFAIFGFLYAVVGYFVAGALGSAALNLSTYLLDYLVTFLIVWVSSKLLTAQ